VPQGVYGTGKLACEELLLGTREIAKLSILRLPFVIGAYDRSGRLGEYLRRIESGLPIEVYAGGGFKVEMISAFNAAEEMCGILHRPGAGQLVTNVCAGPCMSWLKHLEIIREIVARPFDVIDLDSGSAAPEKNLPFVFPFDIVLDRRRIERLLPGREIESWRDAWASAVAYERSLDPVSNSNNLTGNA
jgi:nucleoside-diphosphate-sugar epimerase